MTLLCFAAGGTGGHVVPAATVADLMAKRGYNIHVLTDTRALKFMSAFPGTGYTTIASGGWVGESMMRRLQSALLLLYGIWQSRRVLGKLKPAALVGFGGYPTLPPLIAAWTLGIPTLLHEQNTVMGLANRIASRFAKRIALSFDTTHTPAKPDKIITTGNPIRADIAAVPPYKRPNSGYKILVFGGSQGAKILSDIVPAAIATLPVEMRSKISLTLQAREEDHEEACQTLSSAGLRSFYIQAYLNPIAAFMADAHLLICRSGATTVAEVAAAGRPAIFIPLPSHTDNQQTLNTAALKQIGSAISLEESHLSVENLRDQLHTLLQDPNRLATMATAARSMAKPEAAEKVADLVENLLPASQKIHP